MQIIRKQRKSAYASTSDTPLNKLVPVKNNRTTVDSIKKIKHLRYKAFTTTLRYI